GAPVQATITSSSQTINLNEGFIQFNAQVQGASDITWDFGDGSIVAGVLSPTHIYTLPGTYTVTFIASNVTCMDVQTIQVTVRDVTTGINDADGQVFAMYPNPANAVASIRLNLPERESEISVFLLDGAGKLVKTVNFTQVEAKGILQLDVSELATGVYQVLLNGDKISSSARLTISR
ncbi:MAG: T9SS type A sorting domain-containing protein, partial [Bacteroidia bacterium]